MFFEFSKVYTGSHVEVEGCDGDYFLCAQSVNVGAFLLMRKVVVAVSYTHQMCIRDSRKSISEPHRTRDVFWGFTHAPENKDLTHLSFALYQGMIKSPATFA